jgi:hypothetical protein
MFKFILGLMIGILAFTFVFTYTGERYPSPKTMDVLVNENMGYLHEKGFRKIKVVHVRLQGCGWYPNINERLTFYAILDGRNVKAYLCEAGIINDRKVVLIN